MLKFFLNLSVFAIKVFVFLGVASILIINFWCRYLCQYGALLGLVSLISPIRVSRREENCTDCELCTEACPNQIKVHEKQKIISPECNACLNCINDCPQADKGALGLSFYKIKDLPTKMYPVLFLGVVLLLIFFAKITGHWETGITKEVYKELIPKADYFNH
jgi:polyferredoxin